MLRRRGDPEALNDVLGIARGPPGSVARPMIVVSKANCDLYAVADVMDELGWHLNRNTDPNGLHLMLSPAHAEVVNELLADLARAVAHHGVSSGKTARYS